MSKFIDYSEFVSNLEQLAHADKQAEKRRLRRENLLATIVFISSIVLAEMLLRVLEVPEWLIPLPSNVIQALVTNFSRIILPNALVTLTEVAVGFSLGVMVGISLGGLVANYRILDKLLSPYILILITTPIVALVPLLMLWLGYGMWTKIIAVGIASFPPIMMNTITGLDKTPTLQLDLLRYLGASQWQIFWKVKFYNALSSLFTGLIIGAIFGLITAVSSEFVGGSTGLGNRLIYFASTLETRLLFAIITTLAIIGVSIYLTLSWLRSRVIRWRE